MGFLAPWFLAGLVTVALPIWLHLLRQHKTTPLPFSSLMFFERRTESAIKHRRLRYLLLFALRTALLVLLAFAFSRPFVNSTTVASAGGGKLIVLAIDHSFSMRQGDRLARAKADAEQALSGLRPEDRGEVLSFGSHVQLMGDPTSDRGTLRAAIHSIRESDDRSSFAELARALRSLAQSARMPVEAHLFSDMQKTSLPSSFADLRLGERVKLVPHQIASRAIPNFAVENVLAPRRIYDPKKVRIQVTVASYGGPAARRRVALMLNGREQASKSVELAAGGRASVDFLGIDTPYGLNRGEVRIDSGDAFPADDHFYFSVERSDPRFILFVHDARDSRGLLYYRTALESSREAAFTLDVATPQQAVDAALQRHAFVVLSDVSIPAGLEQNLASYVSAGGSVLIALGPDSASRRRVPVTGAAIRGTRYAGREGNRFETVTWLDSSHPATRRATSWDDVKFYQTAAVEPGNSRVLARTSDNNPLLVETHIGEGRVLVFASSFDNISNDFPLHPGFVPFVEETAHDLGHLDDRPANFAVGSYLELHTAHEPGAAIDVLDPRGARALTLAESTRAQNIQLTEQGYYEVHRPNHNNELVAVNPDRRESDFSFVSPETLALWQNTGQGSSASVGTGESERKPLDFWWYAMLLVLIAAIAESLIGNWHLAVDKEAA